jgi:hypothetical protein
MSISLALTSYVELLVEEVAVQCFLSQAAKQRICDLSQASLFSHQCSFIESAHVNFVIASARYAAEIADCEALFVLQPR